MESVTQQQKHIADEIIKYIRQIGQQLFEGQKQKLIKSLLSKKIKTKAIRQSVCYQDSNCHEGYLLVKGTVTLSRKTPFKTKVVLNELSSLNILNIEAKTNKWITKYTVTVSSSYIKYIIISQQQLLTLYNCQEDQINSIQQLRDDQFLKKVNEQLNINKTKRQQQLLNKLSLPQIQPQTNSLSKRQLAKSHSRKKQLQKLSERLLPMNDYNSFSSKQIAIYRENKNIQLRRQTEINNTHSHRNDKIFKQQLKNIIKRKLVYERKHLAVLKAFRQESIRKQSKKKDTQSNQGKDAKIDDYFL